MESTEALSESSVSGCMGESWDREEGGGDTGGGEALSAKVIYLDIYIQMEC